MPHLNSFDRDVRQMAELKAFESYGKTLAQLDAPLRRKLMKQAFYDANEERRVQNKVRSDERTNQDLAQETIQAWHGEAPDKSAWTGKNRAFLWVLNSRIDLGKIRVEFEKSFPVEILDYLTDDINFHQLQSALGMRKSSENGIIVQQQIKAAIEYLREALKDYADGYTPKGSEKL